VSVIQLVFLARAWVVLLRTCNRQLPTANA
jgi:hypothetical protein